MEISDIRIIHHREAPYSSDAISQLTKLLSELQDRIVETYAWRVTYKGQKHGHVISGTRSKPITDEDIILLIEHMVKYMEKLGEGK